MKCPYCGHDKDKVVDSRPINEGTAVRRRRKCLSCLKRFTTYEKSNYFTYDCKERQGKETFLMGEAG
jgi:transcriptional regulator NrdR family protein